VRIVGAGLDRKSVHRCGSAVLGATGAPSRRGRRAPPATALGGVLINAPRVKKQYKQANKHQKKKKKPKNKKKKKKFNQKKKKKKKKI
jgi:hypothetical protein